MNKIIVINRCEDCPFFDNYYYDYNETCTLLNKANPPQPGKSWEILEDCPLKTTDEETTKEKLTGPL